MNKLKLFVTLFFVAIITFSCESDKKEPFMSFEIDGQKYEYSKKVECFTNLASTITIQGFKTDTILMRLVIPSLPSAKTSSNFSSDKKSNATLQFQEPEWHSSDYGTDATFIIDIKADPTTDGAYEGTFSGKLGSLSTSLGIVSKYVEIKNGKFYVENK